MRTTAAGREVANLVGLADEEIGRPPGTRKDVEQWLRTRAEQTDSIDWSVYRADDGECQGQVEGIATGLTTAVLVVARKCQGLVL